MGSTTEASSVAGGLHSLSFFGWAFLTAFNGWVEGARVVGKAGWEVLLPVNTCINKYLHLMQLWRA